MPGVRKSSEETERGVGGRREDPLALILGGQAQTVGVPVVVPADGETPPGLEVPENKLQSRGRPVPEGEVVRRDTVPVGVDVLDPPLQSSWESCPGTGTEGRVRGEISVVTDS